MARRRRLTAPGLMAFSIVALVGATSSNLVGVTGPATVTTIGARVPPDEAAPLSDGDFADPFLLETPDGPIAFASNNDGMNVPEGRVDANGDPIVTDALPTVPAWEQPGFVWAPAVIENNGRYLLYYTANEASTGLQCVSVASSESHNGPYVDTSDGPLICDRAAGGSIDPSPVRDDNGALYLLTKSDGNCCGWTTAIYSQQLDTSGTRAIGQRSLLMTNDQRWEGNVVEAPSMAKVDGTWVLLYSGNDWDSANYAVGYAVCDSVDGPCTKPTDRPLLASDDGDWLGPGGAEFANPDDSGGALLVLHAWVDVVGYQNGSERHLFLRRITVQDGLVGLVA